MMQQIEDDLRHVFVAHQQADALEIDVADQVRQALFAQGFAFRLLFRPYAFCFSLQVMQTRVQGMALRRASAIGSPQSLQMP